MTIKAKGLLKLLFIAAIIAFVYIFLFAGYFFDANKCRYEFFLLGRTKLADAPPSPCVVASPMTEKQVSVNRLLLKRTYETYMELENGELKPITSPKNPEKFNKQVLTALVLFNRHGADKAMSYARTTAMVEPKVPTDESEDSDKIIVYVLVNSDFDFHMQQLKDMGYDTNVPEKYTESLDYKKLNMFPVYTTIGELENLANLDFVKGVTIRSISIPK